MLTRSSCPVSSPALLLLPPLLNTAGTEPVTRKVPSGAPEGRRPGPTSRSPGTAGRCGHGAGTETQMQMAQPCRGGRSARRLCWGQGRPESASAAACTHKHSCRPSSPALPVRGLGPHRKRALEGARWRCQAAPPGRRRPPPCPRGLTGPMTLCTQLPEAPPGEQLKHLQCGLPNPGSQHLVQGLSAARPPRGWTPEASLHRGSQSTGSDANSGRRPGGKQPVLCPLWQGGQGSSAWWVCPSPTPTPAPTRTPSHIRPACPAPWTAPTQ